MEFSTQVTKTITEKITQCSPVVFLKYGDGEYQCANHFRGGNCDADTYTIELGNSLIESFKYISQQPAVFIGAWPTDNVIRYWTSLVPPNTIQWADYHTIIVDKKDILMSNSPKIALYKSIRDSPLPKIIVCNELLVKAGIFFGNCEFVHVPFRRWFNTESIRIFEKIQSTLENLYKKYGTNQAIFIFSAGMSSKVVISELYKIYPQNIYLDFGSALDILCTKRDSRGRGYSYHDLCRFFAPIMPPAEIWENPKYEPIYATARRELGIHL